MPKLRAKSQNSRNRNNVLVKKPAAKSFDGLVTENTEVLF